MAHEVEQNGLIYSGETPWHRIGERITEEQSRDIEYIKAPTFEPSWTKRCRAPSTESDPTCLRCWLRPTMTSST
jgi:hypothetical protein